MAKWKSVCQVKVSAVSEFTRRSCKSQHLDRSTGFS